MNHLAHFFLSGEVREIQIGNFIADYIPVKNHIQYDILIRDGIKLHYFIDQFTDAHRSVRQSVRLLHPTHHKYAPVVLDVVYDHLLANQWATYTSSELSYFTRSTYDNLLHHEAVLPEKIRMRLTNMINNNWLMKYKEKEGLRYALGLMEKRLKFPCELSSAVDVLYDKIEAFQSDFDQFFPELKQACNDWLQSNGYKEIQ